MMHSHDPRKGVAGGGSGGGVSGGGNAVVFHSCDFFCLGGFVSGSVFAGFCRCFLVCVVVVSRWEELLHHVSQACSTVSMYAMCTKEHLYKDCQGPRVYYLYKYKNRPSIYICMYLYIYM